MGNLKMFYFYKNLKMRNKYLILKSSILIVILGLLGFYSCGDNDDIQPEYGVKVVNDKQILTQQYDNDSTCSTSLNHNID